MGKFIKIYVDTEDAAPTVIEIAPELEDGRLFISMENDDGECTASLTVENVRELVVALHAVANG